MRPAIIVSTLSERFPRGFPLCSISGGCFSRQNVLEYWKPGFTGQKLSVPVTWNNFCEKRQAAGSGKVKVKIRWRKKKSRKKGWARTEAEWRGIGLTRGWDAVDGNREKPERRAAPRGVQWVGGTRGWSTVHRTPFVLSGSLDRAIFSQIQVTAELRARPVGRLVNLLLLSTSILFRESCYFREFMNLPLIPAGEYPGAYSTRDSTSQFYRPRHSRYIFLFSLHHATIDTERLKVIGIFIAKLFG